MTIRWQRRHGIIRLTARSLEAFSDRVKKLSRHWGEDPWFRGQDDARKDLRPNIYRAQRDDETEDELRWEFQRRFRQFPMTHPPTTDWEQYFVMQHYGIPTRLLDWTQGALLALYFALRRNDGTRDAAVWALDPFWLLGYAVRASNVLPKDPRHPDYKFAQEYMPDPSDERTAWIRSYLPPAFSKEKLPPLPAPLQPPYIDRRISAQLSAFTIHGTRKRGLEYIARSAPRARLAQIRIPRSNVKTIRKHLTLGGVVETTVFQDLEGLGRELRAEFAEPTSRP